MDKVVITGVEGGIGQSLYETFRENDWSVIGLDQKDPTRDYFDYFQIDLSDRNSLKNTGKQITQNYDELDSLVNNAAFQKEALLLELDLDDWEDMLSVNLTAPLLLSRTLKPLLSEAKGGSIVNISSIHSRMTSPGLGGYAASKGGLNALTRAMALEWADDAIRVNAVLPGAVDTPLLKQGLERFDNPEEAHNELRKSIPLQKISTPDDIAALVYFLVGGSNSATITGQEFVCDGGVSAKLPSE